MNIIAAFVLCISVGYLEAIVFHECSLLCRSICTTKAGHLDEDCVKNYTSSDEENRLSYFLSRDQRSKGDKIGALDQSICGQPDMTSQMVERIVGGEEAEAHGWPWMASVRVNGEHLCGASLIDNQWLITAAHCEAHMFHGDLTVVLGSHDLVTPAANQIELEVEWTIPHEHYSHRFFDNDVMLLKLAERVEFSGSIRPVCLPGHKEVFGPRDTCVVIGWGRLSEHGPISSTLQQAVVPIISSDVCNGADWYQGLVSRNMLCAGHESGGTDACKRDSGGPLVCMHDGMWKLAGVVSWGAGCGEERRPGVYAKASRYTSWVRETIARN